MFRIVTATCIALLALTACSAKAPSNEQAANESPAAATQSTATGAEAVAKDLVSALAAGDMTKATANFDAQMTSAMPASTLSQVWSQVTGQFGAFKNQAGTRTEKAQGYDVVFVTCEFERGKLDVQVTVDSDGKVSGLFIKPA